ncbi:MAG: AraC family transcriptional regulator [Blastocatellia bacterium]|nr:AraC family transcriptional regulator [Blastocatellia bacterium]MCS7157574.1 AraC family transcriptional regulator [Blastocatellia bacterium]MCX7753526.1 AraC family transcriptional regulator [Blastocatellia bacterium]MDW8166942.1 AraC family transcriptional regulator [Acidobacteriota bacterium]MDW8257519.1 AraC family transcriptional regulator [Acidobacteriota bacterium]
MAGRGTMAEHLTELIRALLEGETSVLESYSVPVARVLAYLRENFHEALRVGDLAAQARVSRSHFYRLFRREVGLSPMQFVCLLRVERSKRLLASRRFNVIEVWQASGFSDLRSFERAFKRWVSATPKEYQKSLHAKPSPTEK